MNKKFSGVYTALVTPFLNGKVDKDSLSSIVRQQMVSGVAGFVVNGTTAESPTLRADEVKEIFHLVRDLTQNSLSVILGVGTNSTQGTLDWVNCANEWGADGVLAVVPYYNKPPQRGLILHFEQVAEASQSPVILYNVPGRTIQSLSVDSIRKLSQHRNIVGIKESTGDLEFLAAIKKEVPRDFSLLSGDDGTAIEFCLQGGDGLVGVVTHLIPKQMVQLIERALNQDSTVTQDFKPWLPLVEAIYVEANPIPVKKALHIMKLISSAELRSPLCELDSSLHMDLEKCLKQSHLV